MPRKSRKYFTEETEECVKQYIKSNDINEKEKILNECLYKPFYKIAEYTVNKGKYYNLQQTSESLIKELISYFIDILPKYDNERSSAFNYLTFMGKIYITSKANKHHKNKTSKIDLNHFQMNTFFQDNHYTLEELQEQKEKHIFLINIRNFIKNNIHKFFLSELEKQIVLNFIDLFDNYKNLEKINKINVYKYIKNNLNSEKIYNDENYSLIQNPQINNKYIKSVLDDFLILYQISKTYFIQNRRLDLNNILDLYLDNNIIKNKRKKYFEN